MAISPIVYMLVTLAFGIGMLFLGVLLNKIHRKKNPDGMIFLGLNDDGDDRIVFQLNMDYDDLKEYDTVLFNVVRERKAL